MTTTLKVGDEVRVYDGRTKDGEKGTVEKVGRKLVTIKGGWGWTNTYRLDTQQLNGPQYGYGHWFRTLSQVAEEERKQAAVQTLRSVGLVFDHGHALTTDQIEELAAVVKGW